MAFRRKLLKSAPKRTFNGRTYHLMDITTSAATRDREAAYQRSQGHLVRVTTYNNTRLSRKEYSLWITGGIARTASGGYRSLRGVKKRKRGVSDNRAHDGRAQLNYRKFGGKRYAFSGRAHTKSSAQKTAALLRRSGNFVRVTKYTDGYEIWQRR